jgi:muramoyltetrapeptide carboxypeptidase
VETASSVEYLRRLLFGAPVDGIEANPHELNVTGTATGTLIGGNLCLLCHLLGSSSDVDYNGKILFLEDVGEQLYRIDRMMIQLKRAGKLAHLKGLVIGQFTENTEEDLKKYGHSAQEIIHLHTREYSYPVAFNFPIGHVDDNMPVVVGATAELEVKERGNARLRYIKMSDSRQAHYTAK